MNEKNRDYKQAFEAMRGAYHTMLAAWLITLSVTIVLTALVIALVIT